MEFKKRALNRAMGALLTAGMAAGCSLPRRDYIVVPAYPSGANYRTMPGTEQEQPFLNYVRSGTQGYTLSPEERTLILQQAELARQQAELTKDMRDKMFWDGMRDSWHDISETSGQMTDDIQDTYNFLFRPKRR